MDSIFSNTKEAFSLKTNFQLHRAKFLFKIIESKFLVRLGTTFTNFSLKFRLPVTSLIKFSVFNHFCGGISEKDCEPVIFKMYKKNVHSVLDFSTEAFNSEEQFDDCYKKKISIINFIAFRSEIPFAVFKPTCLGRIDLFKKVSSKDQLSFLENQEWNRVVKRFQGICQKAFENNIKILIDAEETFVQNAIDDSYNLAHVGVLILSYSKRIMNEVMGLASDNKIDIYYQDTDSMHLKNVDIVRLESLFFNKYNRQIRGENLSQFHSDFKLQGAKKEVVSVKSIFLGKKSYVDFLQSENDKGEIITGYHLRMKGISESALQYASETKFKGDYFKLYESLSNGNEQKFILNPYKHSVSFEYVKGGIRSRGYQEFERVVKF